MIFLAKFLIAKKYLLQKEGGKQASAFHLSTYLEIQLKHHL